MQAVLFSPGFQAPEALDIYAKALGYTNLDYHSNFKLMFDARIINFCKANGELVLDRWQYSGRPSKDFRVGYAGFAVFEDIDINRKWVIQYDNRGTPVVRYVVVCTNEYNHVQLEDW